MNPLERITDEGTRFLTDRHLATLSSMSRSGSIHVVAVGFTLSDGIVRIITSDGTQKVRNLERDPRATVAQVEGAQWLSIAGLASIERDPDAVALAESLYAQRYRAPRENPKRVVIRIAPTKVLGSTGLVAG